MPNATPKNKKAQQRRARKRKRDWVGAYKMARGCADCGFVPLDNKHCKLEMDHLPQYEKYANVADMIGWGAAWERIKAEIAKCEVVCRPCHVRRTSDRAWRSRGLQPPLDLPDPY